MTNEPEPNTRAGEALKPCPFCGSNKIYADQYVRDGSGITCGDCNTKIWEYHGPPHMPSPQDRCRVRWNTRPLPQPSELVERLERHQSNLCRAICPHYTEQNWPHDPDCQTVSDAIAQLAKLQADGDKLAGALEQLIKHTTWLESVAPPMCIDGKYMGESLSLADACQALTEWKDRA